MKVSGHLHASIFQDVKWKQNISLKCLYPLTRQHGLINLKDAIQILAAMKTPNLILIKTSITWCISLQNKQALLQWDPQACLHFHKLFITSALVLVLFTLLISYSSCLFLSSWLLVKSRPPHNIEEIRMWGYCNILILIPTIPIHLP
jgi:hypothetical protein